MGNIEFKLTRAQGSKMDSWKLRLGQDFILLFSHQIMSDSFATLQNVVHQASLSMGFPRQEYWSRVAIFSSRGSSQPREGTHVSYVSCIEGDSLPLASPGLILYLILESW